MRLVVTGRWGRLPGGLGPWGGKGVGAVWNTTPTPAPASPLPHPPRPPAPRRHSLDELEAMVRSKFAGVSNTPGAVPPAFDPDAITPAQEGRLLRMLPQRDGHSIELQWATLPEQRYYRAAPLQYVSHLLGCVAPSRPVAPCACAKIGMSCWNELLLLACTTVHWHDAAWHVGVRRHEGDGSAFALLKARGWATGLAAGESGTGYRWALRDARIVGGWVAGWLWSRHGDSLLTISPCLPSASFLPCSPCTYCSARGVFMCRIDLTDEGQAHAKEVVAVVFRCGCGEGGCGEGGCGGREGRGDLQLKSQRCAVPCVMLTSTSTAGTRAVLACCRACRSGVLAQVPGFASSAGRREPRDLGRDAPAGRCALLWGVGVGRSAETAERLPPH